MFIWSLAYKDENGNYFIDGTTAELKSLYFIKNFFDATSIPSIFAIITIVNYTWFKKNLSIVTLLFRFEIYGLVEYP